MSDYKFTLNLPETEFPMRGNLANREPEMLERWTKDGLYQQIRDSRIGCTPLFCMTAHRMRTAAFILVTQ